MSLKDRTAVPKGSQQIFSPAMLSHWLRAIGIDWRSAAAAWAGFARYQADYRKLTAQNRVALPKWSIQVSYLSDFSGQPGNATGHYFHQDLFVAQRIFARKPERHVDIGSRIDGFVAHVASFRPIEVFDYRELQTRIPNVTFRRCDLLNPPSDLCLYCDSLSCLHVIEHVGLGRYRDPIDLFGHLKAMQSLTTMLKPGGILYLSAPFGQERIEFNAHRIFSLATLATMTLANFELLGFSYVDDSGNLNTDVNLDELLTQRNPATFCLAIFELQKT
jgi:hypothetical protein